MASALHTTTRRSLLGAAASGSVLAGIRPARAQAPIHLKIATNVARDNPLNVRLSEAITRIKAATNGAVEIQLFPDNQLGSDTSMLSQLRSGALDMFTLSSVILSTLVPPCAITGIGFAFPNYAAIWKAMDGDLGQRLREEIGKAGIFAHEKVFDLSFKEISSSTRIVHTPDDLKGFKLRVPPGPLWISLFNAFGAAPTTITMDQAYTALQTKMVDGTELPLTTFYFAKLYEVQKSISLTRHMWDCFWCLANQRKWDALPKDVQTLVAREINQSALDQRRDVEKFESDVIAQLTAKGMQMIPVDQGPFREKLVAAGFYKEWKGRIGEPYWGLLEKYAQPLG